MPHYSIIPARLLERSWWSGHPFRPHRGLCRRVVMTGLFLLLSLVIGAYAYLTDGNRVRQLAEHYLSDLLGGRIEIGEATLSIFEGFRVKNVKVYVDPKADRPDSLLFSAQSFVLNYDPRKMLQGQLEASEIVAEKPQVFLTLTQTPAGDRWNYQRVGPTRKGPKQPSSKGPEKLPLPGMLLRNAVVEIGEVRNGQRHKVGSMDIDGQLTPAGDGENYRFALQTRGLSEGVGPDADGTIGAADGHFQAHLHNLEFGSDVRSMFPAEFRQWWERHELAGRIEQLDVSYAPAAHGTPPRFNIETHVRGISLAVHRDEWLSREAILRWQDVQGAVDLLARPFALAGYRTGRVGRGVINRLARVVDASPIVLREATGSFVFNQDGIELPDLLVRVGAGDAQDPQRSNAFRIRGRLTGYSPGAPLSLTVSTDKEDLYLPDRPTYMESLPTEVRMFYEDLRPAGRCRISAQIDRDGADAMPRVSGLLEVVDATFLFREFPYPFRGASGKIAFGRDPFSGQDFISVTNMHARGIPGGPNADSEVAVSGRVGPLGPGLPEPGIDLRATGRNIGSEPEMMSAMPREVREALKIFDAPGKGVYPRFRGNFACDVTRSAGPNQRLRFDVDLDLLDSAGRIKGFAYPLNHVTAKVKVHNDYVEVLHAEENEGAAHGSVSGTVRWADENGRNQPVEIDLHADVQDFAINNDLLDAIPAEQSQWLRKLGLAGSLTVNGRIYSTAPANWRIIYPRGHKIPDPDVRYDLAIGVRDGTIWPVDELFSVSGVGGRLHLTSDRLDILELHGRRDNAELAGGGTFILTGPEASMEVHGTARNLTMDRPLYAMLPAEGRRAWDEVQPRGTVDADIEYRRPLTDVSSAASTTQTQPPQTQPAQQQPAQTQPAAPVDDFRAVLRPRQLSVAIKTAPYPLMFDHGSVTVTPGRAVLDDLIGTHGKGQLHIGGQGSLAGGTRWDLKVKADGLQLDDDLHKAMPPALLTIIDGIKLKGTIGFDFDKLLYRGSAAGADPDIDVSGALSLADGSTELGVPLSRVKGGLQFEAAVRAGHFDSLAGKLAFDSMRLGGRPVRDLKVSLLKPAGKSELHAEHLQAKVAGGELAGSSTVTFPDQGANRYTMNLVLRNADVRDLTGETDPNIRGDLTASLSLEGAWGESSIRRGRGDVVVAGKQLYRIPLMLGLLQVTNLSLPIGQPFTNGSARYTVEGTRVNFERMDLHADALQMSGTGFLDFGTRQVRMTLSTDNPAAFKVPFLSDLWQGARQELLKINVRGTVQEPKVEPTSLGIFTTTIDEVFRGDAQRK